MPPLLQQGNGKVGHFSKIVKEFVFMEIMENHKIEDVKLRDLLALAFDIVERNNAGLEERICKLEQKIKEQEAQIQEQEKRIAGQDFVISALVQGATEVKNVAFEAQPEFEEEEPGFKAAEPEFEEQVEIAHADEHIDSNDSGNSDAPESDDGAESRQEQESAGDMASDGVREPAEEAAPADDLEPAEEAESADDLENAEGEGPVDDLENAEDEEHADDFESADVMVSGGEQEQPDEAVRIDDFEFVEDDASEVDLTLAEDEEPAQDIEAARESAPAEAVELANGAIPDTLSGLDVLAFAEELAEKANEAAPGSDVFELMARQQEREEIIGETLERENEVKIVNEAAKPDWYDWEVDYPAEYVADVYKAISFNDRFEFIKELFNLSGDLSEAEYLFKDTLDDINEMENFKQVVEYIRHRFPQWDEQSDEVYRFYMAIRRKFNKQ